MKDIILNEIVLGTAIARETSHSTQAIKPFGKAPCAGRTRFPFFCGLRALRVRLFT